MLTCMLHFNAAWLHILRAARNAGAGELTLQVHIRLRSSRKSTHPGALTHVSTIQQGSDSANTTDKQ